tara:strand:+ start:5951 stop:6733 length:783 start_codon:yes stop_codon:yes gene_type:complete
MDFPTIVPIRPENDGVAKKHHPHLPDVGVGVKGAGECLLMISPRQTGKSTIISSLFLNDNFYGQEFFPGGVVVISPTINMDSTSRFMKKRFECYDQYSPELIQGITARQQAKGDDDPTKEIALVLDDCVGMLDSNIANLVTRSRHYGIKLLVISVQKFRGALDPIIRANATSVIVGSPFPNQKELLAISEEYGDVYNSPKNWLRLYKKCTPKKFDFCYMKLSNPPLMYKNFEKLIATGGSGMTLADEVEEQKELEKSDSN